MCNRWASNRTEKEVHEKTRTFTKPASAGLVQGCIPPVPQNIHEFSIYSYFNTPSKAWFTQPGVLTHQANPANTASRLNQSQSGAKSGVPAK